MITWILDTIQTLLWKAFSKSSIEEVWTSLRIPQIWYLQITIHTHIRYLHNSTKCPTKIITLTLIHLTQNLWISSLHRQYTYQHQHIKYTSGNKTNMFVCRFPGHWYNTQNYAIFTCTRVLQNSMYMFVIFCLFVSFISIAPLFLQPILTHLVINTNQSMFFH